MHRKYKTKNTNFDFNLTTSTSEILSNGYKKKLLTFSTQALNFNFNSKKKL